MLDWFQTQDTGTLLEEMARNDYARDIEEHLNALRAQMRMRPPLGLLPWRPREVLELERFSEPDRLVDLQLRRRGHLKRLLACSILLRNVAHTRTAEDLFEEEYFTQTSASTLCAMTDSAIELSATQSALSFLVWFLRLTTHPSIRAFSAFCVLVLAAELNFGHESEDSITELCAWVISEEAESRRLLGDEARSERWLIGLSIYEKDNVPAWQALADKIVRPSETSIARRRGRARNTELRDLSPDLQVRLQSLVERVRGF